MLYLLLEFLLLVWRFLRKLTVHPKSIFVPIPVLLMAGKEEKIAILTAKPMVLALLIIIPDLLPHGIVPYLRWCLQKEAPVAIRFRVMVN